MGRIRQITKRSLGAASGVAMLFLLASFVFHAVTPLVPIVFYVVLLGSVLVGSLQSRERDILETVNPNDKL